MHQYPISEEMKKRLDNTFTYHSPKEDQPERYSLLRNVAKSLAQDIVESTPPSREQALALTHLEESIFYANVAIARNE